MMFWNFAIHSCDGYNHGQYAQVTYTGETQTEIHKSHIHSSIHSCLLSLSHTHTHIYIYMHRHTHTHTHTHFKTTYTEHFHLEDCQVTELICLKTEDMFSLSLQCSSSRFSQMSEWCFLHHVTQGKNKGTVPFIPSPSLSLSLFNCTSTMPVLLVLSSLCQVFSSIDVSFFKVFNALSPLLTFQTIFFYNVSGLFLIQIQSCYFLT